LFFALRADVQLITNNVYTIVMLFIATDILSQVVSRVTHCRVRFVVHLKLVH